MATKDKRRPRLTLTLQIEVEEALRVYAAECKHSPSYIVNHLLGMNLTGYVKAAIKRRKGKV